MGASLPAPRVASRASPPARWAKIVLSLLVALHVLLAGASLRQKSVTVDEFGHLPAGQNVLATGDFGYARLNPPLMNVLNALGASAVGGPDPAPTPTAGTATDADRHGFWDGGYRYMAEHAGDYHARFVGARMVTVPVLALLGVLAFFWARRLAHRRADLAGVGAAALVLLSPNLMAHGRLVTTDVGAAASMALALFALGAFLRDPRRGRALGLGLAVGLAQLVKFTAIYLYPIALLAALLWPRGTSARSPRSVGRRLLLALVTSLVVIHVGYGLQRTAEPLGNFTFVSEPLQAMQAALPDWTPAPVPGDYLEAFDRQARDVAVGDPSYLLGERYHGGRADYYLVVLGAKLPLPSLLLLLMALGLTLRRRRPLDRERLLLLGVPIALLLFVHSLVSEKQLGLRMVLPILPLLWIWTAVTLAEAPLGRIGRGVALALAVWLGVETARVHPDYLSYFNAVAGGPDQGHRVAVDSNLDWGQDLIALKGVMAAEGVDTVQLLYFGRVDPAMYGIDYSVPPEGRLRPGLFAVSDTFYGRGYLLNDHGRLVWREPGRPDPAVVGPPIARPGHSMRVYRIPEGG